MNIIDLRSDTVTRPSAAMLQAMLAAPVGDDVWGDDPTVNRLQGVAATMFGKEAAIFCPSGTMTNQIAIKCHTSLGDECICSNTAHIFLYEGGGMAFNSGVQARVLQGDGCGRITAEQVAAAINADDQHYPTTRLVCIEISALCRARGLALHLDGARVFNAIVAGAGYSAKDLGGLFDSISVCLSKGLGCPVGSLLLGSSSFIAKARRVRKVLGGGMRQAGFLAAAGLFALEHNLIRLAEDHARAKRLREAILGLEWVASVAPVDTNIVIFTTKPDVDNAAVMERLKSESGVLVSGMGPGVLRLVTHLDIGDREIELAASALRALRL